MSIENVSLSALVAAIRACADESRTLKRQLRQPWTEPMADAQRALARCRRRATRLLILRAWLRGRFHLASPPRDGWSPTMTWDRERHHRLVAETVAKDFVYEVAS
ncbi:MAG: hypothetical protein H6719_19150 [Sandaracinaceae bacterium]|nr:hypothetical protein [Sandaracinaceae bacterium]